MKIMNEVISDGRHKLSGVGEYSVEDEWNNGTIEYCVFVIDGKFYITYSDPEDGYRSNGVLNVVSNDVIQTAVEKHGLIMNMFPEQEVIVVNFNHVDNKHEWEDKWLVRMFNEGGDEILTVGTENYNDYYPMSVFHWHPENLPINKYR